MKKRFQGLALVIMLLSIFTLTPSEVKAIDFSEISAELETKIRPLVEKYLGEEWATKLFGAKEQEVTLPELPKIVKDARSLDVFDKKETKKKITPEEESKYNLAFVEEIVEVTRNNPANRDEVAKWMNTLEQGATREGIYRAMVLDNVYSGLENYESVLGEAGAEFALLFLEKYIGQTINKDTLSKLNIYTIKREVSERALEIIDSFDNDENLYRWYAVLSSDLAKKYELVFTNKLRKEKSSHRHLNWAREVPSQHLKSEVVIKIHKIFNHFRS